MRDFRTSLLRLYGDDFVKAWERADNPGMERALLAILKDLPDHPTHASRRRDVEQVLKRLRKGKEMPPAPPRRRASRSPVTHRAPPASPK